MAETFSISLNQVLMMFTFLLIGYYEKKGIVRTYYSSASKDFFHPTEVAQEVIDPNFKIQDLLK